MLFLWLLADAKALNKVLIEANKHALCAEVLGWHKAYTQKVKQDCEALQSECGESFAQQAKDLMIKESAQLKKIQERLKPSWTDKVGDFFGRQTSRRRYQVNAKITRVAEFLDYAVENFDRIQKKFSSPLKNAYSGTMITDTDFDPCATHEGFCYKLILIFERLASGKPLNVDGSAILYEFDTLGFDLKGSVFSCDKTFTVPHQGYIFSGQRGSLKHRFGPEDCSSLITRLYPELPEEGFATLVIWAWIQNKWDNLEDYEYMKPILEKTFKRTDQFAPGHLLFIKGHVWIILGKNDTSIFVVSYRRANLDPLLSQRMNANGFVIEEITWPSTIERYKEYFILKPKF